MNIREFVIDSLKGFYQRLPLKKINVDGVEVVPNSYGVAYIETNAAQNLDLAYAYTTSAYNYIIGQMIDNELIVASALTDLNDRVSYLSEDMLDSEKNVAYALIDLNDRVSYLSEDVLDSEKSIAYAFIDINDRLSYLSEDTLDNEKNIAYAFIDINERLSYCVSFEYLENQGYITASYLSNLDSFVTYDYLESQSYTTISYVGSYIGTIYDEMLSSYIDSSSTYTEMASAKAVYDNTYNMERILAAAATDLNSNIDQITSNRIATEADNLLSYVDDYTRTITGDLLAAYAYVHEYDSVVAAALTYLYNNVTWNT